MADTTEISWTDHTHNPWWGCTKVSPGCDHCYAEALDHRFGGKHWGEGTKPRPMSNDNWRKPNRWIKDPAKDKVFCGSMCDWTDKNAPAGQLDRLWDKIRSTPELQWQLLTKRAPNIRKCLPDDWHDGYENVWLGVTVEDCKHGRPRIDILREIPAVIRFLSIEPLLEPLGELNLTGIHWVIVGGESGPNARPMEWDWVDSIRKQCIQAKVPFFFKQWGSYGRSSNDKGGSEFGLYGEIKQWPIRYHNKISEDVIFCECGKEHTKPEKLSLYCRDCGGAIEGIVMLKEALV